MMLIQIDAAELRLLEQSDAIGKKIAKPITPPSETAFEEDSDPEQAQRDKDMQKNLAHIAKKPKRVKDSLYHKEKMLLCKQDEKGVPIQAEQYDWLADTDEEIDEQELEAHYSYMAKIQEVPTADTVTDSEPLEKDNGPEQAQRDKDMQKNLALIAKYFKKIYKPTNNNLRTSSNSKNKNVDMTLWYKNDNQKPKRVKDFVYYKEKMLLCKQAEQGVPLQAEQYDWLADTDKEVDEQDLEAHNSYMENIQEVPTDDTGIDSEPVEQVQNDAGYNVFANDLQHSKQSEYVSNTCLVETDDSNVIPDSPDMCEDDIQNEQNDVESDDEQCKAILVKTSKSLGKSISVWDSCLIALQNKQTEFKKYKDFNDRTIDYDKLEHALDELQYLYLYKVKECGCLAQKLSKQTESVSKKVHNELLKRFAKVERHSISLEIALQKRKVQVKHDTVWNEKASNVFRKECKQYIKIQDLKAQLQDKNIAIKDISTFNFSSDHEADDEEADMNNLDTSIQVSPTLTTRIHKDHPIKQVIRDLHSTTQTRNMSKNLEEHGTQKGDPCIERSKLDRGYARRGFEDLDFPNKVYKVERALYELHQAPRAWYLKVQPRFGLWYPKDSPFNLVAYTDSDYARASLDRKSTTGGCQFLQCRLISWPCKKQTVVANSTTEAEYVAASNPIQYALMVNPTVYTSCIEQFLATVKAKTVNKEGQLQALVDGKNVIITESTIRRDLQLEDAEGFDCLPNAVIFEQLILMSTMASAIICLSINQKFNFSKYIFKSMVKNLDNVNKFLMYLRNMKRVRKGFFRRDTPLFPTMMVQAQEDMGEDEAVNEEMDDSLERAATNATSLDEEQDRGNIFKTQSKVTPNEPGSQRTSSSGGLMCQEAMRDAVAQTRLKRLYKVGLSARVESSEDEGLVEDASKYGRIVDIDANEDITLVSTHDEQIFDADQDLGGEEVDEEVALKLQAELQAEFEKEQRLANYQLAKRLQAEEQQELNDEEKAKLFMQLLVKKRNKGKEIAKPITPPSEIDSEEDSDPEQAQRDKDMQKNLTLIAKYFKKIYKPTNDNLKTSSNLRNKNVDTTPRNAESQKGLKTPRITRKRLCYANKLSKVFHFKVQHDTGYNVFANDLQHSEQSESISNTCIVETDDSNVIPDSPDMCDDDIRNDQNDVECDDELALQNKQTKFEKYKAFNDRTVDYDKLKHKLNETLGQLAQKYIEIKAGLKTKAYEISVVKEKHDELIKQSLLTKSHYEGLVKQKTKYFESLEKEIDELEYDKAEFSNMYDMILQECVSKDVMCSYFLSLSNLDALDELQCLYLHKVKECDCLAQKLLNQTESVSKENEQASNVFRKEREQYIEIQDLKAQLQDKNIAISELKKLIEKGKGKSVESKFDKPSVVRQPNAQRIPKPTVLGKPAPFSNSLERRYFSKTKSVPKTNVSEGLSKPVTTQTSP
nr:putative ribonuclease H-like domain-containing protein [Tanacetum cinerariifolium]